MNGRLDIWKAITGILVALVMFLSGWIWNMEKRVTTLEVTRPYIVESVNEIKQDIKEIKTLVEDHMRRGSP